MCVKIQSPNKEVSWGFMQCMTREWARRERERERERERDCTCTVLKSVSCCQVPTSFPRYCSFRNTFSLLRVFLVSCSIQKAVMILIGSKGAGFLHKKRPNYLIFSNFCLKIYGQTMLPKPGNSALWQKQTSISYISPLPFLVVHDYSIKSKTLLIFPTAAQEINCSQTTVNELSQKVCCCGPVDEQG
jgi:hypothetical protein